MDYKAFAKEIEDANPIVNPEKNRRCRDRPK